MMPVCISRRGTLWLITAVIVAKMFAPIPRMVAIYAGTASWWVTLIAGLFSLGGFWLLATLLERFPGRSLAEIGMEVFGSVTGRLLGGLYTFYFLWIGGLALREFAASFRVAVLPKTPAAMLLGGILSVALFAALRGVEVQTRMAAYMVPSLAVLLAASVLGGYRLMDFRQLAPLFGSGVANTLSLPFPLTSLYTEVLLLGVIAPMLPRASLWPLGRRALIMATLAQTALLVVLGAVFPFPAFSRLFFPALELARMIEVSEFVQRIEALFIFLWFFTACFQLAFVLSCTALTIRDLSRTRFEAPFVLAAGLLTFSIGFLPPNQTDLVWLDWLTTRMWGGVITFGLPALTLAVAMIRRKRGVADDPTRHQAG